MLMFNAQDLPIDNTYIERTVEDYNETKDMFIRSFNSSFEANPNRTELLIDSYDFGKVVSENKSFDERIVSEFDGVVLGILEDFIRIKLANDDELIMDFPKELFTQKPFVKYGRHIKYQIKVDREGYRYQDFVEDHTIYEDPERDELLALLSTI